MVGGSDTVSGGAGGGEAGTPLAEDLDPEDPDPLTLAAPALLGAGSSGAVVAGKVVEGPDADPDPCQLTLRTRKGAASPATIFNSGVLADGVCWSRGFRYRSIAMSADERTAEVASERGHPSSEGGWRLFAAEEADV